MPVADRSEERAFSWGTQGIGNLSLGERFGRVTSNPARGKYGEEQAWDAGGREAELSRLAEARLGGTGGFGVATRGGMAGAKGTPSLRRSEEARMSLTAFLSPPSPSRPTRFVSTLFRLPLCFFSVLPHSPR
jgi:hypothetical protein